MGHVGSSLLWWGSVWIGVVVAPAGLLVPLLAPLVGLVFGRRRHALEGVVGRGSTVRLAQ